MKVACDLHIHTALSPCGDMDMTPNNIVNMALLKGLEIIAITDHNHIGNVEAVMACASEKPLLVIPGMELETAEEAHFICLFPNIKTAKEFYSFLSEYTPSIKNKPEIFGEQVLFDQKDRVIGYEESLLTTARTCSIYDCVPKILNLGGVIIPAHVDKSAYSIISNLGFIPPDLDFKTIEISRNTTIGHLLSLHPYLKKYHIITNSDAHYLGDIFEDENKLEMDAVSVDCLFSCLTNHK